MAADNIVTVDGSNHQSTMEGVCDKVDAGEQHKTDTVHGSEGQRLDIFKGIDEDDDEDGDGDEDEDEDTNTDDDEDEGEDQEEPVHSSPIDDYEDEDEEVQRQFEELSETRESFWIRNIKKPVYFHMSDTWWKFGRFFSERQFHNYYIAEASAICMATQIKGPNPGLKAIAKVRAQFVSISIPSVLLEH